MSRRRGLALLAGAAGLWLLTGPLDRPFTWVPLLAGAVCLLAALAGGRKGGLWGPAAVLLCFGAAVVALDEGLLDTATASTYLVGVGVAVVVAALLGTRGFAAAMRGTGRAVVSVAFAYLLASGGYEWPGRAGTCAVLFAAWGAVELARR